MAGGRERFGRDARAAMAAATYAVVRGLPGSRREILCLAGLVHPLLAVAHAARVAGGFPPPEGWAADLVLREMASGRETRIEWAAEGRLNRLLFLRLRAEPGRDPEIAAMDSLDASRSERIAHMSHRPEGARRPEIACVRACEGSLLAYPEILDGHRFGDAPEREPALLGLASLEDPAPADLGAPLFDANGRTAGFLTALRERGIMSHQAYYTPADLARSCGLAAVREMEAERLPYPPHLAAATVAYADEPTAAAGDAR